jgi:uncharacterized membrane protein
MNKREFLHILEMSLSDFTDEEKREILYDYEEHFRIGKQNGKSEDELIKELGDPNNIANQYRTSNYKENIEIPMDNKEDERPIIVSMIAICGLLLFNLIFILGPFIGIVGAIIGLFAAAIALILGGIAMTLGITFGVVFIPFFPQNISVPNGVSCLAIILFSIGTVALGLLFLIGMYYVGKYLYKGTVKYINWNLKIIKGR